MTAISAPPAPGVTVGLTVAVCTRARPGQLRRALRSIQAQDFPPAEVLVVDNAPDDDTTRRVVDEFPGVRYVAEPTPGLDFARNRALREATQDIVAFLDDDAIAEAGWTGAVVATFQESEQVGACTGRVDALELATEAQRLFEANGGFARGGERLRLPRDAARPLHGRRAPLIAWAVSVGSGCSLAVRRELALRLGGFDEALDLGQPLPGGGDHDMLWRILQSGHDVIYEPAARAWHEHRRELEPAVTQIVEHQRALVALLTKTARGARGRARLPILAFLGWRLVKPGVRLVRRAVGRDPVPALVLARMWWGCWRGLVAYRAARRVARARRRERVA